MKKHKIILLVTMFLPLVAVLIALPVLPEEIPAHYGFTGQVDRWGSKYETLVFPAFSVLFGLFMLGMAKYAGKQEENGRNNERICLITGNCCNILFVAMTGFFLYTDFQKVENLNQAAVEINQIIFGLLGVGMVVIGNLLPKTKRNSMLGLRTSWSMKNDVTWQKSQWFAGVSCMIAGGATVVFCLLVKGLACLLWWLGISTAVMIVDVVYTYRVYKRFGGE